MRYVVVLIFLASTAGAEDMTQTQGFGYEVDCFCTDKNRNRHELGSVICMQVGNRTFMAQCQMSQNVPMWREQMQGCPGANMISPDGRSRRIAALLGQG